MAPRAERQELHDPKPWGPAPATLRRKGGAEGGPSRRTKGSERSVLGSVRAFGLSRALRSTAPLLASGGPMGIQTNVEHLHLAGRTARWSARPQTTGTRDCRDCTSFQSRPLRTPDSNLQGDTSGYVGQTAIASATKVFLGWAARCLRIGESSPSCN